jgi:hypothetical protein
VEQKFGSNSAGATALCPKKWMGCGVTVPEADTVSTLSPRLRVPRAPPPELVCTVVSPGKQPLGGL